MHPLSRKGEGSDVKQESSQQPQVSQKVSAVMEKYITIVLRGLPLLSLPAGLLLSLILLLMEFLLPELLKLLLLLGHSCAMV